MAARLGRETTEFGRHLFAEILDHAEVEGQEAFLAEALTDVVLGEFEEEGLWPDYQLSFHRERGAEISAWGLDDVNRILYLATTDFAGSSEARRLPRSAAEESLRRLTQFFERAKSHSLNVPEHSAAVDVVQVIGEQTSFDSVQYFLISNRVASDDTDRLGDGVSAPVRVWDLEAIRRFRETGAVAEPIQIDFVAEFGSGIPCLVSPNEYPDVDILLAFVPGEQLAKIYQDYGPRLLERNVRSFLMARGKINRGIRDTLRDEPGHFLAYNNGITATASEVTLEQTEQGPSLVKVEGLQIVNGGQTTASIAVAGRDSEVALDQVAVQMKLVVVATDALDTLVPNISRFANRQNAIQESDLSANHDHLRLLQSVSRTEWTPSHGTGRPTKWYFERARGSYAVDKVESGTRSDQKRFVSHYPPRQKFGKNELAIYELTWARQPHLVCRGGQKSFAEYMASLPEFPDADEEELRDVYRGIFRDLAAKAILFKTTDRLVRSLLGGTYKRQTVAYTVSYLLENAVGSVDLKAIWNEQSLEGDIERALAEIAEPLKEHLIESGAGFNITEWAKQEACWTSIRMQHFPFAAPRTRPTSTTRSGPEPLRGVQDLKTKGQLTLAEAIEETFGERIDGAWRRYRRKKWVYTGDTGVMAASGRGTYHVFEADFTSQDRGPYTLEVVVDFPGRTITPVEQLPPVLRKLVIEALEELRTGQLV